MSDYCHLPPYRVDFSHIPLTDKDGVDWALESYGIPSLWKQSHGDGVMVAVVDTGIAPHSALTDAVVEYRNFTSDSDVHDSNGHGCISPDDEVYTSACGVQKISTLFDRVDGVAHFLGDGSIIKDISRLDIHTLGYDKESQATVRRKVLAVHKLPYTGRIINVTTREGQLSFTPWHPIYVQTSQRGDDRSVQVVRADEVAVGQKIVASRESEGVYSELHHMPMAPRYECRHCGYVARSGKRKACRQCKKLRWHSGPAYRSVPLDEDLAFFLGLVASDGHVTKRQKTIGFTNNNPRLSEVFDHLCFTLFGKHASVVKGRQSQPQVIDQRLHHADAWNICAKQIGMPSDKSLCLEFPELVAKSNPSVILSFIAGVIEGDGNICNKTGRIRIATGSKKFADRMVSVCRFLGMRASCSFVKPSPTGFANTDGSWCIRICHHPALASKLRVKKAPRPEAGKERRAVSVRSVCAKDYYGFMYDLTVEGSHNYAANGIIVSNTHCAGVIGARSGLAKGIAPGTKLLSLKVLGHSGMGANSSVAEAVRYATEAKADIISMSLGSTRPDAQVHDAIRRAHDSGIIVVCAAGNDGGSVNFPAAFSETIAVGAVDKNGSLCEFSSRGKEIAVAAPGAEITSTWLANGYATVSGTSMAAPFVAGVLSLYVSAQKKDGKSVKHADVMKALSETCRDVGEAGRDTQYGWGLLDPHKMLTFDVKPSGVTIFIPGAKIL